MNWNRILASVLGPAKRKPAATDAQPGTSRPPIEPTQQMRDIQPAQRPYVHNGRPPVEQRSLADLQAKAERKRKP